MSAPIGIKSRVEFHAVQTDALWACRFIMSLPPHPERLGVAAVFSAFNYLSLFRYESLNYLNKHRSDIAKLLRRPTTDDLKRSRNTVKLFDVSENVDGVIDHFTHEIEAAHSQHFLGNTWLPLARPLERDLGLTFYGDRVIYTTQGVAFILGAPSCTLLRAGGGQYLQDGSMSYGEHFGAFWDRSQELGPSFVDKLDAKYVKTRDVRAADYYGSRFSGPSAPGITALLLVFLSSLNFLDVMLRLDDLPESRQTVLKMQFITLYHLVSSLKKLRDKREADLSPQSLDCIDRVLEDSSLGSVIIDSSQYLRNALIHYGLHPSVQASDLNLDVPCYGLIEKYLPGYDYASLSAVVGNQITRLAKIFNEWI